MSESLLPRLLALEPLCDLPRTGWIMRGITSPESIADHVLGTAYIALAIGPRCSPPIDSDRAVALALVHDVPEALLGDLPRSAARLLPPGVKHSAEDRAAEELLRPMSPLAWRHFQEYSAQATREARFVRICDRLQLGVRLVSYLRRGVRGLDEFAVTVGGLDCSEFAPAESLKREIVAAVAELDDRDPKVRESQGEPIR